MATEEERGSEGCESSADFLDGEVEAGLAALVVVAGLGCGVEGSESESSSQETSFSELRAAPASSSSLVSFHVCKVL